MNSPLRLIVGLGNPGAEYAWTPHNLGFLAVDALAARAGARITRPECQAYIGRAAMLGQEVLLAKPQTYMNGSGRAVSCLLERFACNAAEMIVLSDDVALPWGMLRIRERGSAGSHNGLKSVIGALGTDQFLRVRMGVKPEHPIADLAVYVLARMGRDVVQAAEGMIADAAEAVELILREGVSRAMSRFNRRVPSGDEGVNQP